MVPGPGQTHLLYGTMKLVKLGQMSRSITEYSFRELIFTKIFVKLVSWKILVVARLICTLLIPSHIIFFTDLLLSANQFACDLFCKNKNSHTQLKKSNLSHWRYSCFDAVWCREQTKKLYPNLTKKIGIFFEDYGVAADVKFIEMVKKNCAIRQRRLWKPLCCDLYPELYWNLLWELWDMLCPLKKRKKSVVCLQSQVNKTADCETAADIVQKKLNRRISFVPPYFCPPLFIFSCGNKN